MKKINKNKLHDAIQCMFYLYKDMKDPNDIWKNQQYLQGVRDCIQAFKIKGVIKDYNLFNGNFDFVEEIK